MTTLPLPIGISDFKELIKEGCYFVDKTPFIEDVVTDKSKVMLFTRPRRFGKTINLSMLYYFLTSKPDDICLDLFDGTAITKNQTFCAQYQNQYPVLFISFKVLKDNTFPEAMATINALVSELYDAFQETLLPSLSDQQKIIYQALLERRADKAVLKKSLFYFCQFLHKHTGKQPYVLIDEYDTPITTAYVNGYYDDMVELMRGILGEALKDSVHLKKGVITGITRVSQESIFSGLNNIDVYSLLREQCGQYFGFTEAEVKKLLADDGHPEQLAEIKAWYNGYQVDKHILYNPWSIINCVKQGYKYQPYWLNTSDNALIKEQLLEGKEGIKEIFIALLQGNPAQQYITENLIFPELQVSEAAIWSLLHASGYLNIQKITQERWGLLAEFSIPNREVGYVYDGIITGLFQQTLNIDSYRQFTQALTDGQTEKFHTILAAYLLQSGSFFDFSAKSPEQVFYTFMLGLVVGLRDDYLITSNQESGFGRYDLSLVPKNKAKQGLLLEFKTAETAEQLQASAGEALAQIQQQQYTTIFTQQGIASVLLLGLAFCGKRVEVASAAVNL